MHFVNRRQLVIEWGHCDPANIVFNSRYFEFADWSTALLFEAVFGMSIPAIKAKFKADMPLVDAGARFLKPVTVADLVEIASMIETFKRSSFVVIHQFVKSEELVAEIKETRVWVGADPSEPSRFKSKPIPAEVIERMKMV